MQAGAALAALVALLSSLALASAVTPPYVNAVSLDTQKHVRAHAHTSQSALWPRVSCGWAGGRGHREQGARDSSGVHERRACRAPAHAVATDWGCAETPDGLRRRWLCSGSIQVDRANPSCRGKTRRKYARPKRTCFPPRLGASALLSRLNTETPTRF